MCCLKCLLGCLTIFGCRDALTRKLAFFPPDPPSYSLVRSEGGVRLSNQCESAQIEVEILKTRLNERIPVLYMVDPLAVSTLIYCHGNSTDIGELQIAILHLSSFLNVNIALFEYSGFGKSTGKCSESNLYADIEAVYQYVLGKGVHWSQIILFGESLGSVPACHLASHSFVGGVILKSPISSCLNLIGKEIKDQCGLFDMFRNLEFVQTIRAPVFVMHGTDDQVVPIQHGILIASKCQMAVPPWWVQGAGHDDIDNNSEYFVKIQSFIRHQQDFVRIFATEKERIKAMKPQTPTGPKQLKTKPYTQLIETNPCV